MAIFQSSCERKIPRKHSRASLKERNRLLAYAGIATITYVIRNVMVKLKKMTAKVKKRQRSHLSMRYT